MSNTLASLVVKIAADVGQLTAGLESSQRDLRRWERNFTSTMQSAKTALGGLGVAFGASEIVGFVKRTVEAGDHLIDLAGRAQVSAKFLSVLGEQGRATGNNVEDMSAAIKKMNLSASEALDPASQAGKAYAELGVSVRDSNGIIKDSEQLYLEIAAAVKGHADGLREAQLLTDIFGRSGSDLIPILNGGAEGFEEAARKAERLGAAVDAEASAAIERFAGALDTASTSMTGLGLSALKTLDYMTRLDGLLSDAFDLTTMGLWLGSEKIALDHQKRRNELLAEQNKREIEIKENRQQQTEEAEKQRRLAEEERSRKKKEAEDERLAKKRIEDERKAREEAARKWEQFADELADKHLHDLNDQMEDELRLERDKDAEKERIEKEARERSAQAWFEELKRQKEMNDTFASSFGTIGEAIGRMGENFTRTITQMVMTGKFGFKQLLQSFEADFLNIMIHKMVTEPLWNALFGTAASGFAGGFFGKLFGGGTPVAGARAAGGPVMGGSAYLVGEQGPELFMPRTSGTILPNGSGIPGNAGSAVHIASISIGAGATPESVAALERTVRNLQATVGQRAVQAVADARRRGGSVAAALG